MNTSCKYSIERYTLQVVLTPVNNFNESAWGRYPGFNPGVV